MKKKRRKKEFIFQNFLVKIIFSLSFSLLHNNRNTKNRISLISFFLSLSLLYSAHYVFCGVSSITDDELVFVKKKVFYTTHIRKRERDGRGL